MAYYAYKCVCYGIDYEKWKSLVKQFEEENDREHDGDGNYDGDNWYVAEMWIRELIAERDALKKDAERYRWLRSVNTGPSKILELLSDDCSPPVLTLKFGKDLDAAIDAELDLKCPPSN